MMNAQMPVGQRGAGTILQAQAQMAANHLKRQISLVIFRVRRNFGRGPGHRPLLRSLADHETGC